MLTYSRGICDTARGDNITPSNVRHRAVSCCYGFELLFDFRMLLHFESRKHDGLMKEVGAVKYDTTVLVVVVVLQKTVCEENIEVADSTSLSKPAVLALLPLQI